MIPESDYKHYFNNALASIIQTGHKNHMEFRLGIGEPGYYLVNSKTGEPISGPYEYTKPHVGYGIEVKNRQSLYWLIDYDGNSITPEGERYDYLDVKNGFVCCKKGNYYTLFNKRGRKCHGPYTYRNDVKVEMISYNFSNIKDTSGDDLVSYFIGNHGTTYCTTYDNNGYTVKHKGRRKHICTKGDDTFVLKYSPMKIYDKKYAICVDWNSSSLYLCDRDSTEKNNSMYLGSMEDVEFHDNLILVFGGNFKAFLIYNGHLHDITDYYETRFGHKYDYSIRIEEGKELLTKSEFSNRNITSSESVESEENDSVILPTTSRQDVSDLLATTIQPKEPLSQCYYLKSDIFDYNIEKGYWEIKDGEKYRIAKNWMDNYCGDFKDVKLEGIDFSDCTLTYSFDPQEIYDKSLQNCTFLRTYFPLETDFTDVNICGCTFADRPFQLNDSKSAINRKERPIYISIPTFKIGFNSSLRRTLYDDSTKYNGRRIEDYFIEHPIEAADEQSANGQSGAKALVYKQTTTSS